MNDPEHLNGEDADQDLDDSTDSDDSSSAEPDLKTLLARIDILDKADKLTKRELANLKSIGGRINAYQSKVDKLEKVSSDSTRVTEIEETIDLLLEEMANDLSEPTKRRLAAQRTERERAKFKAEIVRESAPKDEFVSGLDEWGQTTLELLDILRERGIDQEDTRIKDAWNPALKGGETDRSPRAGYARMLKVIEKIEADDSDPAAAKGKRNAGAGSPNSTGAGTGSFKSRAAVEKAFYEGKIDQTRWRSIRRGAQWANLPEE